MSPNRTSTAALCAALLFATSHVGAQEVSAENKAAARDLAVEGIQLAQEGNCADAIPKLKRADQLFHAPTILTWIGQCQIETGHYVEGTETLNQVIREKIPDDAPEAYLKAQEKAQDLIAKAKPKIAKLTIEVSPEEIEGVEVQVDERSISSALIGAPKPTDPGTHTITVTAPGYKPATQEVEVGEGGRETVSFTLEVDPNASSSAPAQGDDGTTLSTSDASGGSSNWVGWATVGVGGALLAGGGVMGFLALDKKNSLECEDSGACPSSQQDTLDQARTNATVSTVLFGVGGAAVVTGIVLLATGKSSDGVSDTATRGLTPQIGLGTVGLSGRF